ncbi:MAG: glycosyl hydrolase [Imperialibacter sp.]|uniref:WD40/YVTN/BNR-like repeat-containing protein n=1 Tax=Imperialibacter sp. TaxID=2038411 RepID=UPI0032EFBE8F
MMKRNLLILLALIPTMLFAQKKGAKEKTEQVALDEKLYAGLEWRNIGPTRGGRSTAVAGVLGDDQTYYMGTVGGGVWKTTDACINWKNITDGFFNTGTIGAISVAASDPNVIYVGTGEAPIRGVMTSSGDGLYKSTDAGKTWSHIGLENSMHISKIAVHPTNPDLIYVGVQGNPYGPSDNRGVYKSTDGGKSFKVVHFVNEFTGVSDLSMDESNPRILYAAMWDHQRQPWYSRSGGAGSGIFKSVNGGETWEKLSEGLPKVVMGKIGVSVSPADPERVYAIIESDEGGLYRSDDAGKTWKNMNKERVLRARSWYYMHIQADPVNADVVYVMNAPLLRSIDGGKSFANLPVPHGDTHSIWINPARPANMVYGGDGGAAISFNTGKTWSTIENQPTAQFYRINADNRFPYWVYGGQQDNSSVAIPSSTNGPVIEWQDWIAGVGGCESAYVAFDPNNPILMYAGCYQGIIDEYNLASKKTKGIKAYPESGLGEPSDEVKYRFNWNAPIIVSQHNANTIYHAGNKVLRSTNRGMTWEEMSGDLTRNDSTKLGLMGGPITNEAAGGEIYHTIYYLAESPHDAKILWAGADDGLLHITRDAGKTWTNISPKEAGEGMINSIEVSPHTPGTAYVAFTKYKFGDFTPYLYKTTDYGQSWQMLTKGIGSKAFVRVVREDPNRKGLLFAGTERGLYISFDAGQQWSQFKLNFPMTPVTDLKIHHNDLLAATSGRAFWILDDITALQELTPQVATTDAYLYKPREVVKSGNAFDLPNVTVGKSAYKGALIRYHLKEMGEKDSTLLKLEIADAEGKVLRTFNSASKKKAEQLPKKAGMNVLKWDLRGENIETAEGVFVPSFGGGGMSSYMVGPGTYTITLTFGDKTMQQALNILPDPRDAATLAQHREKQHVLERIALDIEDIYQSLKDLQQVRKQLKAMDERLGDSDEYKSINDKSKAIIKKVGATEEKLIQPKQETFQDVVNFRSMLDSQLYDLLQTIDGNSPPLTDGEKERYSDLKEIWNTRKTEIMQILNDDVPAYNKMLEEKGVPYVAPNNDKKEEKLGS